MNTEQRDKVFIWEATYDLEIWRDDKTTFGNILSRDSNLKGVRLTFVTESDSVSAATSAVEDYHGKGAVGLSVSVMIRDIRFVGSSKVYKSKP